tara:strand:+ start:893 stop:1153 length:261 start_codon:yes stop_codon:yes gene_type:complete
MPSRAPYERKRRNKIQTEFTAYKKTLACSYCGLKDHRVLDFHHEQNKEQGIAAMLKNGCNLEAIMKEVSKCIPLCSNCHRIVHWKD